MKQISRRTMLGTAATMMTTAAFAEGCPVGPPQHHKGPLVFMDYDQRLGSRLAAIPPSNQGKADTSGTWDLASGRW